MYRCTQKEEPTKVIGGTEGLKDILWDIYRTHKSWGDEWYDQARKGQYDNAKILLVMYGKGEYRNKALDVIDELIERGE